MEKAAARSLAHVERFVTRQAWAVTLEYYALIWEVLAAHQHGWRPTAEEQEEIRARAAARMTQPRQAGTVCVLPLQGLLVPRASSLGLSTSGTSMEQFGAMLDDAVADPTISHIVLDIDSPGGVVDQIPEMAERIRSARQQKPVTAVANARAASAAYWLACQASDISITPSGEVGSIGVLSGHQDISGAMAQQGIRTTLIAASASPYKLERNPFEPLSDEARAQLQAEVDDLCQWFISDVARGRGTSPETVAETFGKGRMVSASEAVRRGMADRVETLPQAVSRLVRANSGASSAHFPAAVTAMFETGAGNVTVTSKTYIPGTDAAAAVASAWNVEMAGPIPAHSTPVVDEPWDAGEVEKSLPEGKQAEWKTVYAWYADATSDNDPDGDGLPDAKADWKFPHHTKVDGPANVNAVRNGLARLNDPDTKIPEGDTAGVRAHLQRHLDDFHSSTSKSLVPGAESLLARRGFREAFNPGA